VNFAAAAGGVGTARFDGANDGTFVFNTGDNAFRVDGNGFNSFDITTGSGNDSIRTGHLDEVLTAGGRAGTDRVVTGLGDDLIYVGRGGATIDGGAGVDGLEADLYAAANGAVLTADMSLSLLGDNNSTVAGFAITGVERFIDLRTGDGNDTVVTRAEGLTTSSGRTAETTP
jgi:hypothetical protein